MINVALVGIGNCASTLVQGIHYYKNRKEIEPVGLMHKVFGKYTIGDIKFVAAFDIDSRKVGKDLSEAIFTEPNCTKKISSVPKLGVKVSKGPILDGVAPHMKEYFMVKATQKVSDVVSILL